MTLRTRSIYETSRPCQECKRPVDAIRITGASGLHVSRHLKVRGETIIAKGFCLGSLVPVPRKGG